MSWVDRLKPNIKLTSPEGKVFTPYWRGNPRNMEKTLGIFKFPKVKGLKIQDLDVGGVRYQLTLLFAGPDNDLEANNFFKACKERGLWTVDHPVKGALLLQLVFVTEDIQPVTSGNITQIKTEWLESKETNILLSTPELATIISNQVNTANLSALEQFVNNVTQTTAGFAKKIQAGTDKITGVISRTLGNITKPVASLNSSLGSIQRSIQNTITQATIDITTLGGQIQQLVQLPAMATTDIQARLNAYSIMIGEAFNLLPENAEPEDKNTVSIHECVLSAAIVAVAQSVSSGTLETRAQTIQVIETVSQIFSDITDNLDNVQDNFQSKTIDTQYFSQSTSFPDNALITAQAIQYLQTALFDLAVEKRFILEAPRCPIEITITEYGGLEENDRYFDEFIAANRLKGNDILLLPSGREVVVYV